MTGPNVPENSETAAPSRRTKPRAWLGVALWAIVLIVLWLTWGPGGPAGRRVVTVQNASSVMVTYSFTESVESGKPRTEFKGVLAPGESATVRSKILDQFVFWHDGPGRAVMNVDGKIQTIRVELAGDELIARGFKLGETMP